MPEPQPVLIVRSVALGLAAAVILGACVAGVCKLVAPAYDAGRLTISIGMLALIVVAVVTVGRGDARRKPL